jgi:Rps23 Pro-64 3,4-dihydroxylase Tpa1-like proline 4-hydroxylase
MNSALEDYILVIKNLVPHELCDYIVNSMPDDFPLWKVATVGNFDLDLTQRNCHIIRVTGEEQLTHIDNELFSVASKAIQTYHEKYQSLCQIDTGYDLLRYDTGGFYTQHVDSFKDAQRSVTSSFMLNDDYEGGEFAFFNRKLKYKLNKGDAIMFPSTFMYPHEVMPVTSGKRYAVITWYV